MSDNFNSEGGFGVARNSKCAEKVKVAVSVIVPTFNAQHTLHDALESVAQQTILPIEIIVVDDSSTDNTVAIVKALQQQYGDQWLRLLELPNNMGAGAARNAGWDLATGRWIAFLDSDDIWVDRKLEFQVRVLEKHPNVVVCGHAFSYAWNAKNRITSIEATRVERISSLQVLLSNPFVTPSVMLRRDIPFRFMAGKRYMEDHLLWMQIVLSGYLTLKLCTPLVILRKHQFGASGLSAQLWAMEKGELQNYFYLKKLMLAGPFTVLGLSAFSLLKYMRRILTVFFRKFMTRVSNF